MAQHVMISDSIPPAKTVDDEKDARFSDLFAVGRNIDIDAPLSGKLYAHKFPLTDSEWSFFINIGLVGDMSCGKSTLLNAMLGDIFAETGCDRATKTVHQYCEHSNSNSQLNYKDKGCIRNKDSNDVATRIAQNVLENTKSKNKFQDDKYNEKMEEYNKKGKVMKYFLEKANKKPIATFYDLPKHNVCTSTLIKRINKYDNKFRIFDFPGFGDPSVQEEIFTQFKHHCSSFDFLFYLFDCEECLKTDSSLRDFNRIFDILKKNSNCNKTKIVFIFNKFDTISIRTTGQEFVEQQKEKIIRKMTSAEYNIPRENFSFFSISANELLMKRIILDKDHTFVDKHSGADRKELEDNIRQFGSQYMANIKIGKMIKQRKTIKQQIEAIHNAMVQILNDDDDMNITDEKNNHDHDSDHGDEMDENGSGNKPFESFLQDLRSFTHNFAKAMHKFQSMKILCVEHLREFFVCVFCLLKHREIEKENMYLDIYSKNNVNIEKRMHECLIGMTTTVSKVSPSLQLIPDKSDPTITCNCNYKAKFRKMVKYTLIQLQHNWALLSHDELQFGRILAVYIKQMHADLGMIREIEKDIDLKMNTPYYLQLFLTCCITVLQKPGNSNYSNIQLVKLMISTINRFCDTNEKKLKQLTSILTQYPSIPQKDIIYETNCRAIDLISYYFDINQLRKILNFEDYKDICSKFVKRKDIAFDYLIKAMKNVFS